MPLQKPPPRNYQHAKAEPTLDRGQLQQRRRTLQTISELSVTDVDQDDFNTFVKIKPNGGVTHSKLGSSAPGLSKRQSLPRYCSSPACLQARQYAYQQPSLRPSNSQHLRTSHQRHDSGQPNMLGPSCNTAYNAPRTQFINTTAFSGQQKSFESPYQCGQAPAFPQLNFARSSSGSEAHPTYETGQLQFLRNSRSFSGVQSPVRRQSTSGGFARPNEQQHDWETEISERASTDSSSYRASYDSAIRRSRSGSSSDTSCSSWPTPPPLPVLTPPHLQRYHTMSGYMQYNQPLLRHKPSADASSIASTRTSSLPAIHVEHIGASSLDMKDMYLAQQKHQIDIQKARLQSLAALTAAQDGTQTRRNDRRSLPSQLHRYSSNQSRPRSDSYLKPVSRYNTYNRSHRQTQTKTDHSSPNERNSDAQDSRASFEARPVPKRESLTRWKSEREEAKAEFEGLHRAKVRERVQRANEMELEKEKELVELGKRTITVPEDEEEGEDEEERKKGCFGGFWAMMRRNA